MERGRTDICTDNPYVKQLQAETDNPSTKRKASVTVQLFDEANMEKARIMAKKATISKEKVKRKEHKGDEDVPCIYCSGLYTESVDQPNPHT